MELFVDIDFSPIWQYRIPLLWGLLNSVWMFIVAFILSIPIGLILVFGRLKFGVVVRFIVVAFVDFVRFTPLLVQAVWIHFALPALTGVNTSATQSGLIVLTVHVSAYVCEVLRSGIAIIPKGQYDAAQALGMNNRLMFFKVILPQLWPLILPPLANVAVAAFKLTAILGILAINDLMKVANRVNNLIFRPVEVFTTAALMYLFVGLLLIALVAYLEKKYQKQ